MPSNRTIAFHTAPRAVFLAGTPAPPTFTEEELEAARQEAYHRGSVDAARRIEGQIAEQRSEVVHLQSQTFAAVAAQHEALVEQLRQLVPELVGEACARILAGSPIDRDTVVRIVTDLLLEIAPGNEAIEVQLHPKDIELLGSYDATFRERHSALVFRADAELRPGDCIVRSRFGTLDGRLATKLRTVEGWLR